jgi:hypothetical protein
MGATRVLVFESSSLQQLAPHLFQLVGQFCGVHSKHLQSKAAQKVLSRYMATHFHVVKLGDADADAGEFLNQPVSERAPAARKQ